MKLHTLIRHACALYRSIRRRSIRAASLWRAMPLLLVALPLLATPEAGAALAAQTLDPQGLVVPASALGPDWSLANQSGSQGSVQTHTVMYHNDLNSPSPRAAVFTVAVTPNSAVADAFVEAVHDTLPAQGLTFTPWQGLGDGRGYKSRAITSGGAVGLGYVFRLGQVGVFVEVTGQAAQEQAVEAQARQFAGLQQDRVRAALQPSAPASPTPATAPSAPPTPPVPAATAKPAPVSPPVAPAPVPAVPADPYCRPGEQPQFHFGFATLSAKLGGRMGSPTSCEYGDPRGSGDTLQATDKGLSFYRQSTNTPTFTTGFEHWALTDADLVYWTGDSIDPPGDAQPAAVHSCLAPVTARVSASCRDLTRQAELALDV